MMFIRPIKRLTNCKYYDKSAVKVKTRGLHLAPPFLVEDYIPVAVSAHKSGLLKVNCIYIV